ncbi:MAG: hypothetical protein ACYTG3_04255 [Planctomycetota bacterium]|jgi:hypothetical protein
MRAVADHKKALEKRHGRSVSRKVLTRVKDKAAEVHELVENGELTKALAACGKLRQSVARHPAAIRKVAAAAADGAYAAAGRKLDELEAGMRRGGAKAAERELAPLARAVKGTPLQERARSLLETARSQGT